MFRKKTFRKMREEQARYATGKVSSIAASFESLSDAECSVCGKPISLLSAFGSFGEQEADGLIFEGQPVCLDCLEIVQASR